jgi:hypothetical protein
MVNKIKLAELNSKCMLTVLTFTVSDPAAEWAIYFWDPDLNTGSGGWTMLTSVLDKNQLSALITRTGLYVLVKK